MPYARLSDDALEHPKLVDLEPVAICLWVEGLVYCTRHLTDGHIRRGAGRLFRAIDAIDALTRAGLWIETDDGWRIHDYLEHQEARADVMARREKDRSRKRPKGFQTDSARNPDGIRTDSARPLLSSPSTKDLSSSDSSKRGSPQAVDDDERIKPASQIVAARRAALRPDLKNPAGWRRKVAHSLTDPTTEDGGGLAHLAAEHPDWTVEQLADHIQPPPGQTHRKPERVDCDHCHGSGWLPDTDPAQRCDHTGEAA